MAFLALDIGIAHLANRFAHPAEWIPVASLRGERVSQLAAHC